MPKYINVHVQLSGEDGNAFSIIGRVSKTLREAGIPNEEIDNYRAEAMKGTYEDLLRVTSEWVVIH